MSRNFDYDYDYEPPTSPPWWPVGGGLAVILALLIYLFQRLT